MSSIQPPHEALFSRNFSSLKEVADRFHDIISALPKPNRHLDWAEIQLQAPLHKDRGGKLDELLFTIPSKPGTRATAAPLHIPLILNGTTDHFLQLPRLQLKRRLEIWTDWYRKHGDPRFGMLPDVLLVYIHQNDQAAVSPTFPGHLRDQHHQWLRDLKPMKPLGHLSPPYASIGIWGEA